MEPLTPSLPDWLARSAENRPSHLAVQCAGVQWSFAELDRQASHLARQLATAGVREGDRVAVLAGNGLPFVMVVHALTRLGAILVPLNTRLSVTELCWQLRDVQATLLVHDARYAAPAAEIGLEIRELSRATLAEEARSDETVLSTLPEAGIQLRSLIDLSSTQAILYTSGTTGQPKGALITFGMQWWNAVGSALNLGHDLADRWLACLPLFHIGGLSILMRSVIYGISVIVQEKFDPVAVNRSIREERVSIISVVAVMLQRLLIALPTSSAGYPSSLRCVLLGGGPAPRVLLEDCARRGIPVVQTYGLTESCSQAITLSPVDALRKLGSAGRPLLPVQLRINREVQPNSGSTIKSVAAGEAGEILLRGPTITPAYTGKPEATARAIQDGWLYTGDIGYLDEEGYLYVLDRRADLIISGGENIYPAEIEAALLAHPDVDEAGVCGLPDPQWGQLPVAFVRLRDGSWITPNDLLVFVAGRLARYKLPCSIIMSGPLPRNASGKILRRELSRLLPGQSPQL